MTKEYKHKTRSQLIAKRLELKAIREDSLQAFTLLELLLVIAIIAVLAGIIMVALNPADRLREANQTKYLSNANDIEKAFNSYVVDNGGNLPNSFTNLSYGYYDICRQGQSGSCISLDELVSSAKMSSIPSDSDSQTATTTGFKVKYDPAKKEAVIYTNSEYLKRVASGTTLIEGLIGYWKMDEPSWNGTAGEVIDSSGNNKNGTTYNGLNNNLGLYSRSGNFDGINDVIDLGIGTDYFPMQGFSICTWLKTPGLASGMSYNGIVGITYGLTISLNSLGKIYSYVDNGTNVIGTTDGDNLYDNQWHHICVTHDGTKKNIYSDGVKKAEIAGLWLGTTRFETNSVVIGHENNNPSVTKFNGKIDETRIYKRALNSDEVNSLFLWGPEAVSYYKLNEGSGVTAYNSNNANNTAILINGANWVTGKYESGISFTGSTDYLEISSPFTNYTNQITVSLWVNPGGGIWAGQSTASVDNMNTNVWLMHAIGSSGVSWYVNDSGAWKNVSTGNLPINQWSYITGISNEQETAIFVNGVKIQTTTGIVTGIQNNPSSQIHFGKDSRYAPGTTGRMMIGKVDSIKIYNYARTQNQIVYDMNNP